MTSRKWFAALAIASAVGAMAWVAFGNLGENLVYYWTPAELHQHGDKAIGATVRLGGMVKPGSIVQPTAGSDALTFVVTDATDSVIVRTTEIPPAMFREGIGVVVEGTVDATGTFQSKRLMVKHDSSYKAPTSGQMPDQKAMFGTLSEADPKAPGAPDPAAAGKP